MERWPVLIRAATVGDLDTLRTALDQGVDPNGTVPTAFGYTDPLLVTAAAHGQVEVVRLLLDAGASPTIQTDSGRTPMKVALERRHVPVAKELLARGVPPLDSGGKDSLLRGAVRAASEDPHTSTLAHLETLLEAGMPVLDGEESAVVQAVEQRAVPAVLRVLLRHGGSPDDRRADGVPVLTLAAIRDDPAAVDALLAHGADPEATDPTGRTALMRAAERGASDVVAVLLAHGAKPSLALPDGRIVAEPLGSLRQHASYRMRTLFPADTETAEPAVMSVFPTAYVVRGSAELFAEWASTVRSAGEDRGDVWFENLFSWPADDVADLVQRLSRAEGVLTVSSDELAIVRDAASYLADRNGPERAAAHRDLHEDLTRQLRR
ncbi:hypothetical protein GCM10010174_05120 [Kutzneria viridogrisea]|uniref:Uncharacterized protein n=2 Tax=Kutzneria TaxID=43356 RepID=W5WP94_9PSEU|nr:ankyrin repeat domain-containing protein [Kutzneria albida]AHI00005.1 hypothetical protein KALB_6645 [Kutzneria albida DSM 43870]MBA8925184.1 hypothetical protein [Kutzneria viridogrisea]